MKKVLLVSAIALFGAVNAQTAGNFKLGAHIGLPVGDTSDVSSFNLGADAAYVWTVAPNFELGLTTGYTTYLGKEFTVGGITYKPDALGIIPVAATGQYNVSGGLSIGADLGYGIVTNSGSDGGFYYQPKIGYNFDRSNVYLGYKGISNNGTVSSINLGYLYKF